MINYVKGDAANPQGPSNKLIMHVCNDHGAWGNGFVLALSKRWKEPEAAYKAWYIGEFLLGAHVMVTNPYFKLGEVQFVTVTIDTSSHIPQHVTVANMVCQQGFSRNGSCALHYAALMDCLQKVHDHAFWGEEFIHAPRIGCGLAGGKWERVEDCIRRTLPAERKPITIYDLP